VVVVTEFRIWGPKNYYKTSGLRPLSSLHLADLKYACRIALALVYRLAPLFQSESPPSSSPPRHGIVLAPAAMSNLAPSEQGDERAPLLQTRKRVDPTPLPARQMFGLLSLLLAEPIMSLSILPYINEVRPAFRRSSTAT